jgi:hypothetical protein
MYTQELIDDAVSDPSLLINDDVRGAAADWIDTNALGRNAAGTIVGAFNSELSETTQTVELANTAGRDPEGDLVGDRHDPRQRLQPDRRDPGVGRGAGAP